MLPTTPATPGPRDERPHRGLSIDELIEQYHRATEAVNALPAVVEGAPPTPGADYMSSHGEIVQK